MGVFRHHDKARMSCSRDRNAAGQLAGGGQLCGEHTDLPLSFLAFGSNGALEKNTQIAQAGGTCFHGVWPDFKDNGASGCWEQPVRAQGALGVGAELHLHPSRHLLAGSWQGSRAMLWGRGEELPSLCPSRTKPHLDPVCRDLATERGQEHSLSPLPPTPLRFHLLRPAGGSLESLTLPNGGARKVCPPAPA